MPKIKCHTPIVDTALHVVKAAAIQVLNTPLTVSVSYRNAKQGRLVLDFPGETAPTEDQQKEIERIANEIVKKGIAVTDTEVTAAEAEAKFANLITNNSLFDKMIPKVESLNVVLIEGCVVNCCAGPHLSNTSEIGPIVISRVNFRPQKNECELVVDLKPAEDPKAGKKKKWEKKKKDVPQETVAKTMSNDEINNASNVNYLSEDLLNLIMKECGVAESETDALKTKLKPIVTQKLTTMKNISFSQGFAVKQ